MSENEQKTGSEIEPKTTEKRISGRFSKGCAGGPGRGHRKVQDPEIDKRSLLDLLERAVRDGLTARDVRDQLTAARAGLNLAKLKGDTGREMVLDPLLESLFFLLDSLKMRFPLLNPGDVLIDRMCEVCPKCTFLSDEIRNFQSVSISDSGESIEETKKQDQAWLDSINKGKGK